jgi:hypothetical protein
MCRECDGLSNNKQAFRFDLGDDTPNVIHANRQNLWGSQRSMKAPDRHSRMLLAGIQIFSDPWTPARNMRG